MNAKKKKFSSKRCEAHLSARAQPNLSKLAKDIDIMRQCLHKVAAEVEWDFSHAAVAAVSNCLDTMIVAYERAQASKKIEGDRNCYRF